MNPLKHPAQVIAFQLALDGLQMTPEAARLGDFLYFFFSPRCVHHTRKLRLSNSGTISAGSLKRMARRRADSDFPAQVPDLRRQTYG